MATKGSKVNQISQRASTIASQKDQRAPEAGSMGLGNKLLDRFKFKKSLRD